MGPSSSHFSADTIGIPLNGDGKRSSCSTEWSTINFFRVRKILTEQRLPVHESFAQSGVGIGESDFESYRAKSSVYIDKSLFIEKFVKNGSECTVILRPRSFGKSLNLSMLKCFLDRKQIRTADVFRNLNILSEVEIVNDHMGKYPVVFLSLKECASPTWSEMRTEMWQCLFEMCSPHIYPRRGTVDNGAGVGIYWSDLLDIHYLKKDPHVFPEGIDDIALRQVFVKLVRRISEIHGMNVIVLVDEYDAPMNVAFKSEDDRQRRANFFRGFFSAVLKDNPAVRSDFW